MITFNGGWENILFKFLHSHSQKKLQSKNKNTYSHII